MLLDVNVLLALAWPNHQHHVACAEWFAAIQAGGWSTCAITELGFIRLSSNPAFTAEAKDPATAAALLTEMVADPRHRYLSDAPAPSACTEVWLGASGHRQTTDLYLAHVAHSHGLKLATLDGRLARHPRAGASVELIPTPLP